MDRVFFDVRNKSDLSVLLKIIKRFGYNPIVLSDEAQMEARQEMIQISKSYKRLNISEEEIDTIIDESRK
jgi:hypothetical protein